MPYYTEFPVDLLMLVRYAMNALVLYDTRYAGDAAAPYADVAALVATHPFYADLPALSKNTADFFASTRAYILDENGYQDSLVDFNHKGGPREMIRRASYYHSPIHDATATGSAERLRRALKKASPGDIDKYVPVSCETSMTAGVLKKNAVSPLQLAVGAGDHTLVGILVNAGAIVDDVALSRQKALINAVVRDVPESVPLVVRASKADAAEKAKTLHAVFDAYRIRTGGKPPMSCRVPSNARAAKAAKIYTAAALSVIACCTKAPAAGNDGPGQWLLSANDTRALLVRAIKDMPAVVPALMYAAGMATTPGARAGGRMHTEAHHVFEAAKRQPGLVGIIACALPEAREGGNHSDPAILRLALKTVLAGDGPNTRGMVLLCQLFAAGVVPDTALDIDAAAGQQGEQLSFDDIAASAPGPPGDVIVDDATNAYMAHRALGAQRGRSEPGASTLAAMHDLVADLTARRNMKRTMETIDNDFGAARSFFSGLVPDESVDAFIRARYAEWSAAKREAGAAAQAAA